jgi:hypothetical protein
MQAWALLQKKSYGASAKKKKERLAREISPDYAH